MGGISPFVQSEGFSGKGFLQGVCIEVDDEKFLEKRVKY